MGIEDKSKKILSDLKSTDIEFVIETIGQIKESGNSVILLALIDLLHDTPHIEINKAILDLLAEMKDESSIPTLISAIKNDKYINERKELVASCWQNGLNYNEHLPLFIDLIISADFLVAFEAFTVIENLYGIIPEEVIEQEVVKIQNALIEADEQKGYLLKNVLTIIRDIPEEIHFTD
ncbi:MAG: HEAT repeat domain-containing protein [Mariniphaga sp.]